MPEGPEVKIIAEQLNEKLQCQTLNSIDQIGGRYLKEEHSLTLLHETCPLLLQKVKCHGKFLWFEFFSDKRKSYSFLANTLGMTGTWKLGCIEKHAAVKLNFERDQAIFHDIRHFGTLYYYSDLWSGKSISSQGKETYLGYFGNKLKSLGLDPLQQDITLIELMNRFQKPITLASLLMRQDLLAGIGNYLKCEILYQAKLSPHRLGSSLYDAEWDALLDAINTIPKQSYALQGASFKTYQHVNGKGGFASFFKVYSQKIDLFGNQVFKEKTADKRTTHWVPQIQK